MNDSLDSTFHETVTAYQQAEALSNAISILAQWRDLSELALPLKAKRDDILGHVTQRASKTY